MALYHNRVTLFAVDHVQGTHLGEVLVALEQEEEEEIARMNKEDKGRYKNQKRE